MFVEHEKFRKVAELFSDDTRNWNPYIKFLDHAKYCTESFLRVKLPVQVTWAQFHRVVKLQSIRTLRPIYPC